jgi:outer membrane lipoprotein carrier protein
MLKAIEARYNHAQTLQVGFVESYNVPGRPPRGESGELTLRKPGKMRWDYTSPTCKLFLSDGKDVFLYTPDKKVVERTKLKESDDMRAPLAFLLGKLDFAKEFRDLEMRPANGNFTITARAKTDRLPYEKVEMLVTPEYQIQKLVVTLQDESILTFEFNKEKLNPVVDAAIFKFRMPPGASFAEQEARQ